MAWSCRSHSPPWSQIGQSSGWLISRNSITPSRAFFTIGVSVKISCLSAAGSGAGGLRLRRAGLHLDQAHAAVAGDRQPLVVAEPRDLLPGQLADLQHVHARLRTRPRRRRPWRSACASTPPRTVAPAQLRLARAIAGDAVFDLVAEVAEQALDRPGGRVAQAADRVALDLAGHVEQQVDLGHLGLAGDHPLHHPPHPAGAFAARRALAAALVLVEIAEPRDRLHQVGRTCP